MGVGLRRRCMELQFAVTDEAQPGRFIQQTEHEYGIGFRHATNDQPIGNKCFHEKLPTDSPRALVEKPKGLFSDQIFASVRIFVDWRQILQVCTDASWETIGTTCSDATAAPYASSTIFYSAKRPGLKSGFRCAPSTRRI